MGSFSLWHWIIVLLVVVIIFGAGKLPKVAGDLAASIKNFKKGMAENNEAAAGEPVKTIQNEPANSSTASTVNKDRAAQG